MALTVVELTPGQWAAAEQVLVGQIACEFGQTVQIAPHGSRPGHFTLAFDKARYELTPQETTTGAVRLEDRKAEIVWLQIPAKSMMLNAKLGQRIADNCLHEQQLSFVPVVGSSLGIEQAPEASIADLALTEPVFVSIRQWPAAVDEGCWICSPRSSCQRATAGSDDAPLSWPEGQTLFLQPDPCVPQTAGYSPAPAPAPAPAPVPVPSDAVPADPAGPTPVGGFSDQGQDSGPAT